MTYAKRRDIFEPLGVEIALNLGWEGLQLDKFDYLFWRDGVLLAVEFKTGNAPLTSSQKDLLSRGMPLRIIRTEEEAREAFK